MSNETQNDFAKVFSVIPDSKSKIKSSSYLESGKYAVVDQGKELVAGYTDSNPTVDANLLPVIVFGDHTRAVKYIDFPFTAGADGTTILKPSPSTSPKYGFYLVLHAVSQIPSKGYARHFGELKKMQFQLPSLERQREIVEKLDSAFAELHASVEMINNLLRFSTELLAEYIQEIYAESKDEITEDLGDLLELLADHRGKTPKKLGSDFVERGIPIISAANISDGEVRFERKERYISQTTYAKWMPKKLRRGDVILTSEAPLGEVAQVDFDGPIAIGQRLYGLRGKFDRLHNDYLRYFLISERGQGELRARETGATAIGIRQSELVKLKVPIVPIALQLKQIQSLKEIELLSECLSSELKRKLELLKELKNAILNEAFLGA